VVAAGGLAGRWAFRQWTGGTVGQRPSGSPSWQAGSSPAGQWGGKLAGQQVGGW
jgi:hypothetical protein